MTKNWFPTARKFVQLLNGFLLSRFNAKIIRAYPETFSYKKEGGRDGMDRLALSNGQNSCQSDIFLRVGTSDWFTFDQIFIHEDYNLKRLKRYSAFESLYGKYTAEGVPLILDLGANIGLSSVYFHHIWPSSKIVAVEPSEDNFKVLQENFGDSEAFEAILAGIASRKSKLVLTDPSAEKNAFTTTILEDNAEGGIYGVTVSEILANYPRSKGYFPFIVKIDIEGFESELFSGNTDWISEFPILIIELHDWLYPGCGTSANFLKTISQLDRDFVYFGENVFSIKTDFAETHEV